MFPSRKDFKAPIEPSDRQLWAIGMVVVQWSQFEVLIHLTASALLQDEPKAIAEFETSRSMQTRLDLLQAAISRKLASPYKERLKELVIKSRDCQNMRDRMVHNAWAGSGNDPINDPQADAIFNWLKPRPAFEWKLNFGKIKDVAARIDALISEWWAVCLHGEKPIGDEVLTLRDALRRKIAHT